MHEHRQGGGAGEDAAGAAIAAGGCQPQAHADGNFVEPTLFTQARSDMRVSQEEIFGPVASTMANDGAGKAVDEFESSAFDALEHDFQEVLQELVGDKSLERFRTEQQQKIAQAQAERVAAEEEAARLRVLADARAYEIEKINEAVGNNPNYIKLQSLKALEAISSDPASKLYFLNGDSPDPLPLMHLGEADQQSGAR